MGYIKSYTNLSNTEKKDVYKFIQIKDNSVDSLEELDDKFNTKIYEYGEGVLFYFEGYKVVASICVVLEVAKILKSAYIHQIKCIEGIKDKVEIIRKLVEESVSISRLKGATDIRLGINKQEISDEELNTLNFKIEYNSFEMVLKNRCKKNELLKLKILNEENKLRYVDIYNDSFSDMPHGTVINIDTVNKNMENSNEDTNSYFIVLDEENNEIGFMEVTIENDRGIFDIGLCKKYRGKGYGKRILETAIQLLVEKQVKEIALIVIEQNKIAYEMYIKRGFEVSQIMGGWAIL
ncbi:GNAT family N-acetyltransferase [Romboutsia sp. 1001713B170131_170501_G6]|uniref:GNAT family N-acetyltransferase n=1 Tax=Romboutsia sp. 1001713B170131_170501_G6 TaxID=2787108 RepID=UPI0018A94A45|nr:GNAT family N-acetyltransferase [Romboutsia sp. 1001713B170131_170501_G6]